MMMMMTPQTRTMRINPHLQIAVFGADPLPETGRPGTDLLPKTGVAGGETIPEREHVD